jgi:hypothetical protein
MSGTSTGRSPQGKTAPTWHKTRIAPRDGTVEEVAFNDTLTGLELCVHPNNGPYTSLFSATDLDIDDNTALDPPYAYIAESNDLYMLLSSVTDLDTVANNSDNVLPLY